MQHYEPQSEISRRKYIWYRNNKKDKLKKVKEIQFRRDGYKCCFCGKTDNLELHHIDRKYATRELRYKGSVKTLCHNCHKELHRIKNKATDILFNPAMKGLIPKASKVGTNNETN